MSSDATSLVKNLSEQGEQAARIYWEKLDHESLQKDPRAPEFANAALNTFVECLESRSAVDRKAIQGAARSAEQLNVSEFHGINEIVQNADDSGAETVALRLRTISGRRYLYIVHDGAPIDIRHVLPIVIPYLTTKDEDPFLKGKFGIGLKTCARFSDRMDVHCAPYNFRADGHSLEMVKAAPRISDFFENDGRHTLFVFRLRREFRIDDFEEWLEKWDSSSLLFLTSVKHFSAQTGTKQAFQFRLDVQQKFRNRVVKVRGHSRTWSSSLLKSGNKRQTWHRYSMSFKVPNDLKRRHKKTADQTLVSVAIPSQHSDGRFFVGLPTDVFLETPVFIDGQFDPDASRERLIDSDWNKWLLRRVGDVLVEAAIDQFSRGSAIAWNAVPMPAENTGTGGWIGDELEDIFDNVRMNIARRGRIKIGSKLYPWEKISYCIEAIEPLISARDVKAIKDDIELLPKSRQDRHGRWRQVLDNFDRVYQISVPDALQLFNFEQICKGKSPNWFVKLAYHAIEHGLGDELFSYPSVLAADGKQVRPQEKDEATNILVTRTPQGLFDEEHGISTKIHSVYTRSGNAATTVTSFIAENGNLFETIDAFSILLTIANSGADNPIFIDDKSLLVVRDLFSQLDKPAVELLGLKLGGSLCVDAYSWTGQKRNIQKTRICDCYLPSAIEKEKLGWSTAADKTPGLNWISPRYANLLAMQSQEPDKPRSRKRSRKVLGSRAFFHALGAETTPRLIRFPRWRYVDEEAVPESQEAVFRGFESKVEALADDSKSPDLLKVLRDISKTKKKQSRKDRGIALFETISKNWKRAFASSIQARAGYHYYSWRSSGRVPATWVAHLKDYAWLLNERGTPKKPTEVGLRNPLTLAIYGNARDYFAAGLRTEGDRLSVAKTIGIETNPKASTIVELVAEMRDSGVQPDLELLEFRYAALARLCPGDAETAKSTDKVGDLTVAKLKNRFGSRKSSEGLIFANDSWHPPAKVFSGKQIFHESRPFVTGGKEVSRLWHTLGVQPPTLSDCCDVLTEISHEAMDQVSRPILIETYRFIETEIKNKEPEPVIKTLPLWCVDGWQQKRPIYYIPDNFLANQIRQTVRVWKPPCSTTGLQSFMDATGIQTVRVEDFPLVGVDDQAFQFDEALQHTFETAIGLLRDYLAENSEPAYRSTKVPWDRLLSFRIFINPNLRIRFKLPGIERRQLAFNALLDLKAEQFWFRDESLISSKDDGCRLIWECFGNPQFRENIELAWHYCWDRAQQGIRELGLALSEESDESKDPLSDLEAAARKGAKRRTKYSRTSKSKKPDERSKGQLGRKSVRRLKPLSELETSSVEILNEDSVKGGQKPTKKIALLTDSKLAPKATGGVSSPTTGQKAYDSRQLEDHALRCLHHVLATAELGELRDLRKFRNVGADSILELRQYFEIKASAGELPSAENFTRSEFDRAKKEGAKFYLAVVTGLEEGYETTVRIYQDPVNTLEWSPSSGVVFTGLSKKKHLAITIQDIGIDAG